MLNAEYPIADCELQIADSATAGLSRSSTVEFQLDPQSRCLYAVFKSWFGSSAIRASKSAVQ
jgi:hypothetical protein